MNFLFLITEMKTVIVKMIPVVGMHHYASSHLTIEDGFTVVPEPNNPYHSKALKVCDRKTGNIVGHIARKFANELFQVICDYAQGSALIRIKTTSKVRRKSEGPSQLGNLGFRVQDDDFLTVSDKLNELL